MTREVDRTFGNRRPTGLNNPLLRDACFWPITLMDQPLPDTEWPWPHRWHGTVMLVHLKTTEDWLSERRTDHR